MGKGSKLSPLYCKGERGPATAETREVSWAEPPPSPCQHRPSPVALQRCLRVPLAPSGEAGACESHRREGWQWLHHAPSPMGCRGCGHLQVLCYRTGGIKNREERSQTSHPPCHRNGYREHSEDLLFSALLPTWKYPLEFKEDKNSSIQREEERALQKVPSSRRAGARALSCRE